MFVSVRRGLTKPLSVGVLGSTRGTDLQAIINSIEGSDGVGALRGKVEIALVLSNKKASGILERAAQHGIKTAHIGAAGKAREQYDTEVCAALEAAGVELVLLIGYMRIVSGEFLRCFHGRCINVHPSLLPEFAGGMDTDVHAQVLAAGRTQSGCTLHFVTEELDGGPILLQKRCDVLYGEGGDTAESLKEKVQLLEGQAFIEALCMIQEGRYDPLPGYGAASCMARIARLTSSQRASHESTQTALKTLSRSSSDPAESGEAAGAVVPTLTPAPVPATSATATPLTYRAAGVDIDAGEALVQAIKPYCKSTVRAGCDAELGGFGGLFDLAGSGYNASDTVLVSGTDGVGTKLKIAQAVGQHHTIGIDLVAMCANDILVCGAEPLFFLDYFATGKLDVSEAAEVVRGIAVGCRQAGAALIGGETAEMAGMYAPGEYDVAGFCVGAVSRSNLLPRPERPVAAGDVMIGLPSTGVHSNGFSLVRKCVERSGLQWDDAAPFQQGYTLGEALLTPTRIYVKAVLPLVRRRFVKALAHITGGGLLDNLPRVLPPGLVAEIDIARGGWQLPPVFKWLQSVAHLPQEELLRTFNCGVGMVLVVDPISAPLVMQELHLLDPVRRPVMLGFLRAAPVPTGTSSAAGAGQQVCVRGTLE